MGIDPEILGNARIRGILKHIKEEAASGIGFTEGQHRFDKNAPAKELQPISRRVVLLEHEIAYIKQELEFIKKIILADREVMRKCSSKREQTSSSESSEK